MAEGKLINLTEAMPPDYQIRPGFYLKSGWELLKKNFLGCIGFSLVALFLQLALNSQPGIGQLVSFVISGALWAGLVIVSLKMIQEQPTQVNDFTAGFKYFLPLLLYSVVSSVFITAGLILLILPGIYLVVGYIFTTWLIVDRRLDFWPAMEISRKTVHKHWFEVFTFAVLLLLINLGGMLCLGLGLLVTVPWTICTLSVAYQDIFGIRSTSY
ncbi:MAG TPA: hypothetical protein DCY27_05235 [Desulfobacterales bacterium]|nr:hypothetical protein [Desulfobacterales bacterium]